MEKPSSYHPKWRYDVYLCFRGADTHRIFIDHLYSALQNRGIAVFREDPDELGESMIYKLFEAIRTSRISIVVFSESFASSSYSLEELAAITKCVNEGTQKVVPVFYHVDPSEFQDPKGRYRLALDEHRKRFGFEKVDEWEAAMVRTAKPPELVVANGSNEAGLIKNLVQDVWQTLQDKADRFSISDQDLVGMDERKEQITKLLEVKKSDVIRFIGIWGPDGIGKTTLARVVYEKMFSYFEGSSFLANVREASAISDLAPLQEKLLCDILREEGIKINNRNEGMAQIRRRISSKRVFVVLDDIDQLIQLESLTGGFLGLGPGSRVIITTRDKQMLYGLNQGETIIYEMEVLKDDEAFQLFCRNAFQDSKPGKGYGKLSIAFSQYTCGFPLALKVLGSFLLGRAREEWESELGMLKNFLHKDIFSALKISYDGLHSEEKEMFLDIACFFNGENKDSLIDILKCLDYNAEIRLRVLADKALITISNDRVWMHDLLQQMGREIVREEHTHPEKRSRLWLIDDLYHVLSSKRVPINVKGVALECGRSEERQFYGKGFSRLENLRMLKVKNLNISGALDHLPDELRYLQWHGYPFKHLPSSFLPDQLVELHMPFSEIELLWKGVKKMTTLKVIDLSHCPNLTKTLDFNTVPNLEKLRLTDCRRLFKVHSSLNVLDKLVELDLQNCERLEWFPDDISNLKSLKIFNLHGCPRIGKLPNLGGAKSSLLELHAGKLAVPISLTGFSSLVKLNLSDSNLNELPGDMSFLTKLDSLNLSGNPFTSIPSLVQCSEVKELSLGNCKNLQSMPDLPKKIKRLDLRNCTSLEQLVGLDGLSELEDLFLGKCNHLRSLGKLPSSIKDLIVDECTSLQNFPEPDEERTSRALRLSFANCNMLKDDIAVAWLDSYLQSLIKNEDQKNGDLSVFLPKRKSPGLCEFGAAGSASEVSRPLPPNWCNENFIGFAICAVFDFEEPPAFGFKGDLFAQKDRYKNGLGKYCTEISLLGDRVSDQLWFLFIPRDKSRSTEWWNTFTLFKFVSSFSFLDLEVKGWGFRMVYKNEVEELIISARSSKNPDLPKSSESESSKGSRYGKSSKNEDDLSEDGNFLEFVLNDSADDDEDAIL